MISLFLGVQVRKTRRSNQLVDAKQGILGQGLPRQINLSLSQSVDFLVKQIQVPTDLAFDACRSSLIILAKRP